MNLMRPRKFARSDSGFTLMESLVALAIFSAVILLFERAVADAWRGIDAANMKADAVTLALRLLEDATAESATAAAQETEGQSGRFGWRRRTEIVDSGSEISALSKDDVVAFWVEADVWWRDNAARSVHSVRYRLFKLGRRST